LDFLLRQQKLQLAPTLMLTTSLFERRVLHYWSRIHRECCRDAHCEREWLAQAWQAGPNGATHNLEYILQCPVYQEEVQNTVTPLSHPEESLSEQIRKELRRTSNTQFPSQEYLVPGPSDVDSEAWMTMPSDEELEKIMAPISAQPSLVSEPAVGTKETKILDDILGGFHTFMQGQSSVEGIAHSIDAVDNIRPIRINPTVFLNILHTVLKAQSPEDIVFHEAEDPFFSTDDFETMESDDDDEIDEEMIDLMNATDQELRGNSDDVDSDRVVVDGATGDAQVLSYLLKSIEAGTGSSGPVQNILKEMGMDPPDIETDEDE
jgi:hypothetical protein